MAEHCRRASQMLAITPLVIQSAAEAVYRHSRRQNAPWHCWFSVTGGRTASLPRSAV
jgi:hypothetical protein